MKSLHIAALVASCSGITLNSEIYPHPDYYADGYSNTWKYTEMPHIVNETAYVNDMPTGDYSDPSVLDENYVPEVGSGDTFGHEVTSYNPT